MKYIYTKSKHYKMFFEKNKTDRLSKNVKILPDSNFFNLSKLIPDYKINEEVFDGPIETIYDVSKINDNFYRITFETKSKTKYRLDIHLILEYSDIINHIAFTKHDPIYDNIPNNEVDYEEYDRNYNTPTIKNEMVELLNRIHFILNDIVENKLISNKFCIGGTEIKSKNKIYEYLLKTIVGSEGFEKMETDVYKEGWGLYFSI